MVLLTTPRRAMMKSITMHVDQTREIAELEAKSRATRKPDDDQHSGAVA